MPDDPRVGDGDPRARRPPRLGESRAPVTTITVLALAAVAVIAGLLILRSVTGDSTRDDDEADTSSTTTTSLLPVVITVGPVATSSTTVAVQTAAKSDAILIVANASGVGGSATSMLAQLGADGYTTSRVANVTGGRLEQSVIYYVAGQPAAEAVARLLSAQVPQAQVAPMPDPPPLDRPLGDATVALLIGRDIAGRPLAELAAG
jgi:hypothetical protein